MMIEDAIEDLILLALEFTPEIEAKVEEDEIKTQEIDLTVSDAEMKQSLKADVKKIVAANKLQIKDTSEDEELTPSNVLSILDKTQRAVVNTAAKELRKVFTKKISEKLILLLKTTIRNLASHFKAATMDSSIPDLREDEYTNGEIVFVLNTHLNVPKIEVQPSVDEIQRTLNLIGETVVSVTKGIRICIVQF